MLAVTGFMHEADDAYSIWSIWSCYWLDQFLTLALNTLILSNFYILLDLSTIYFAHFSGCWASFVCSCHSILECCVMFSGVKMSMGSFVLLHVRWIPISLLTVSLVKWLVSFVKSCDFYWNNQSTKIQAVFRLFWKW